MLCGRVDFLDFDLYSHSQQNTAKSNQENAPNFLYNRAQIFLFIVHSDLLLRYLQTNYPRFYFVSSPTKVLREFAQLKSELSREEFRYVVPDFRLNKEFEKLNALPDAQKQKVEFLCNECCWIKCPDRKKCYENVSRKCLGGDCEDHICVSPTARRVLAIQDRGPEPRQRRHPGISALLHDKAGTPAQGARGNLPGQFPRPVLARQPSAGRAVKKSQTRVEFEQSFKKRQKETQMLCRGDKCSRFFRQLGSGFSVRHPLAPPIEKKRSGKNHVSR